MGMLLCEQNVRDVWSRNESVRAEIGLIVVVEILVVEILVFVNEHMHMRAHVHIPSWKWNTRRSLTDEFIAPFSDLMFIQI